MENTYKSGSVNRSRPVELVFRHHVGYLHAFMRGRNVNLDTARKVWEEIAVQCSENGYKKTLLEKDLAQDLQMGEIYYLSKELGTLGLRGVSVAVVDRKENHLESSRFAATTAYNRGFNHRAFAHVNEAEQWLSPGNSAGLTVPGSS